MEKAFKFVQCLSDIVIECFGYPTIQVFHDRLEVYFDFSTTIRNMDLFRIPGYDEFRMFPSVNSNSITVVYTFYR